MMTLEEALTKIAIQLDESAEENEITLEDSLKSQGWDEDSIERAIEWWRSEIAKRRTECLAMSKSILTHEGNVLQ